MILAISPQISLGLLEFSFLPSLLSEDATIHLYKQFAEQRDPFI